jgi:hypothetical protein
MQATMVMLIALGGLGCQNPVSDLPPILPDVRQSASQPSTDASSVTPESPAAPASPAPMPYPGPPQDPFGDPNAGDDDSFGTCVRNTFCSFFIGRDPGIPTAAEIEAAYHAGLYNR